MSKYYFKQNISLTKFQGRASGKQLEGNFKDRYFGDSVNICEILEILFSKINHPMYVSNHIVTVKNKKLMSRHDCIRLDGFCVDILKVAIVLLTYSGDIQELILTDKSTIVCFTKIQINLFKFHIKLV